MGGGRGYKTTPKWGIKPPPTPFLAIFDPWGGFMPPGGGFIPPFAGVVLSPQRGGFIPPFGHWGGFITPLGWFYPLFLVILSPYWPGGLAHLNVNQETESRKTGCLTPPPGPRNRLVQETPPGSAVVFSHNFFYQWVLGNGGGFIPHKSGHKTTRGSFIPHLGVVLCPGPEWEGGCCFVW